MWLIVIILLLFPLPFSLSFLNHNSSILVQEREIDAIVELNRDVQVQGSDEHGHRRDWVHIRDSLPHDGVVRRNDVPRGARLEFVIPVFLQCTNSVRATHLSLSKRGRPRSRLYRNRFCQPKTSALRILRSTRRSSVCTAPKSTFQPKLVTRVCTFAQCIQTFVNLQSDSSIFRISLVSSKIWAFSEIQHFQRTGNNIVQSL